MKKIKKIAVAFLLTANILSLTAVGANAANFSWFIPRNGNRQPNFPKKSEEVANFDAYYMDVALDDYSDEKRIYLTFDFGYENGNVEKIADVLKEKGVPAAFFILDAPIIKNTDLVIRLANDGHLICNHTKNHKDLTEASAEEIENDLLALERIYSEKTGLEMSKYFRFPEGKYSEESLSSVKELGYKTVFWSFAYEDWDNTKQPSREWAKNKILSNTHNGAVILLHPTSATNAQILPSLIDSWRDMGYTFGTLDELVKSVDGKTLN